MSARVAAMKPMRSKALRIGCYRGSRASLGAERALTRQGHKGRTAARTAAGFAPSRGAGRNAPASRSTHYACCFLIVLPVCAHRFRSPGRSLPPTSSSICSRTLSRPPSASKGSSALRVAWPGAQPLAGASSCGNCSLFRAEGQKGSHRSHFLKDSFCYSRPNLPAPIKSGRPCLSSARAP